MDLIIRRVDDLITNKVDEKFCEREKKWDGKIRQMIGELLLCQETQIVLPEKFQSKYLGK